MDSEFQQGNVDSSSPLVCSLLPLCTTTKSNTLAQPDEYGLLGVQSGSHVDTANAKRQAASAIGPIMRKHDVIHKIGST